MNSTITDTGRAARTPDVRGLAVKLVVALTIGLGLIMTLFVSLAVNAGPNGVRIAVAGPAAALQQVGAGLAAAGDGAFEITPVADEAAATGMLLERTADGAIVIDGEGPHLLVAGAASPAITQALTGLAAQLSGAPVTPVTDVAALSTHDAKGAGLAAGAFPMIMASLALGAATSVVLRRRRPVLTTISIGAVVTGFVFASILTWFGATGGHWFAEGLAMSLTVFAGASLIAGLVRLLGTAGIGIGALVLMILGNPLSGANTSPRLIPGPWGEFGQLLPPGAGATLLRTVSYFPQAPIVQSALVLLVWSAIGIGLLFGVRRSAEERSAARTGATSGELVSTTV